MSVPQPNPAPDRPADRRDGEFLLFVYGTLKRDGPRAGVLAGQLFVAEACTSSGFALLDLGPYPGMVRRKGAGSVRGELFRVARSLVPMLDRVEGAPALYQLEPVALDGVGEPAFAYLYRGDTRTALPIESGCWDNRQAAPWDGGPP